MELLLYVWDLAVHLDAHLASLLQQHGVWVYLLLFLIVFCETGLVVTPFLPGDSLLFVAGTLWAAAGLNVHALAGLCSSPPRSSATPTNYWIGRYLGPKVFHWQDSRWFNRKALEQHACVLRAPWRQDHRHHPLRAHHPHLRALRRRGRQHGPRALPAVQHRRRRYCGWSACSTREYFFGNIPFIRNNLTLVIFGIIGSSLVPFALGYARHRLRTRLERRLQPGWRRTDANAPRSIRLVAGGRGGFCASGGFLAK